MNKRWSLGLMALVMLSLLLSACQAGPTAEEVVAKMREVEASVENAHAVVEFSLQFPGMDTDLVIEMWERSPGKFRAEVIEASDTRFAGILQVTDGQQVWLYHPGEGEAIVGNVGDFGPDEPINPHQVIDMMDEAIQWLLDRGDVELKGEEDLDGTRTYKLEFTPQGGEETGMVLPLKGTTTLWVEQDRWVALQAHFDGGSLGEGWMRVRSYEFNAGVPDERFHFEVPEGVRVIDIGETRPMPLTLDEAVADAEFPLLTPSYLPEGATLINVFKAEGAYVLHYDHAATSFTLVQGPSAAAGELPAGETEEITVRGQAATLVTDGLGNALLTWEEASDEAPDEGGITITIAGRISSDEIVKVAESLE
jgi:outer membrane lipoprotein-sorting protein